MKQTSKLNNSLRFAACLTCSPTHVAGVITATARSCFGYAENMGSLSFNKKECNIMSPFPSGLTFRSINPNEKPSWPRLPSNSSPHWNSYHCHTNTCNITMSTCLRAKSKADSLDSLGGSFDAAIAEVDYFSAFRT